MATGSSSEVDMSHWLYRFLALIIDSIIIGIPVYIIWTFVFWSLLLGGAWWFLGYGSWLLLPLLLGIIMLVYFVVLDVSWGGTVGKRVLGLQVQMVNGGKVPFDKAFIRNISKIYWIFLLLDWIIGIATPGPDRRQKYTDRMAGTTVVSVKQAFAAAAPPPPPPPPS
jgi:uncharacterized RDD family membrane protein YckC